MPRYDRSCSARAGDHARACRTKNGHGIGPFLVAEGLLGAIARCGTFEEASRRLSGQSRRSTAGTAEDQLLDEGALRKTATGKTGLALLIRFQSIQLFRKHQIQRSKIVLGLSERAGADDGRTTLGLVSVQASATRDGVELASFGDSSNLVRNLDRTLGSDDRTKL